MRSAQFGFDQGIGAAGSAERGRDILKGFCGWVMKTPSSDFEMDRDVLETRP